MCHLFDYRGQSSRTHERTAPWCLTERRTPGYLENLVELAHNPFLIVASTISLQLIGLRAVFSTLIAVPIWLIFFCLASVSFAAFVVRLALGAFFVVVRFFVAIVVSFRMGGRFRVAATALQQDSQLPRRARTASVFRAKRKRWGGGYEVGPEATLLWPCRVFLAHFLPIVTLVLCKTGVAQ